MLDAGAYGFAMSSPAFNSRPRCSESSPSLRAARQLLMRHSRDDRGPDPPPCGPVHSRSRRGAADVSSTTCRLSPRKEEFERREWRRGSGVGRPPRRTDGGYAGRQRPRPFACSYARPARGFEPRLLLEKSSPSRAPGIQRPDGTTGLVANVLVGDETGRARLTLWDEKAGGIAGDRGRRRP